MAQVNTRCNVVQEAQDNNAQEQNPVQYYLNTLGTTFAQVKTLCNVVQEAPDNIVKENILFLVVLILLRQHCTATGKNLVQCFPRSSRQRLT